MRGVRPIDPTLDIAGRIEDECFLCSHAIRGEALYFGLEGPLMPELPIHRHCLNGRDSEQVAREYHRRISDLANLARMH